MKMRIVIELEYPEATTRSDEGEVKETLSKAMLRIAREKGFDLKRGSRFAVSEVMVGCAKIAELPTEGDPPEAPPGAPRAD